MVGYRPLSICQREEGVSPVGTCSGRCNQSRTVEKRLRGFVFGLGLRQCGFGRGDDMELCLFLRERASRSDTWV